MTLRVCGRKRVALCANPATCSVRADCFDSTSCANLRGDEFSQHAERCLAFGPSIVRGFCHIAFTRMICWAFFCGTGLWQLAPFFNLPLTLFTFLMSLEACFLVTLTFFTFTMSLEATFFNLRFNLPFVARPPSLPIFFALTRKQGVQNIARTLLGRRPHFL